MFSFLKILTQNILKGPSTDPYPFGKTFEPKSIRGKIKFDSSACVLCKTCIHVCAGGAIKIEESEDKKGQRFTLWHNTCAFCGLCEHYCPTNAIKMTNDYHTAHKQEYKYKYIETGFVPYVKCAKCSEPMVYVPSKLLDITYPSVNKSIEEVSKLCPKCRQELSAIGIK